MHDCWREETTAKENRALYTNDGERGEERLPRHNTDRNDHFRSKLDQPWPHAMLYDERKMYISADKMTEADVARYAATYGTSANLYVNHDSRAYNMTDASARVYVQHGHAKHGWCSTRLCARAVPRRSETRAPGVVSCRCR